MTEMATVEVIGAPFDLCGAAPGSRFGPTAVRLAGIVESLQAIRVRVQDAGDVCSSGSEAPSGFAEKFSAANEVYGRLAQAVASAASTGNTPLVLGGDHSLSIASISGALRAYPDDVAVLWIDAHVDLNTPDTSPSGNLHGMPLAALTRLSGASQEPHKTEWDHLLSQVVPQGGLRSDRICWLALRDVDRGEVENMARLPGCVALTMQDVDRLGVLGAMERVKAWYKSTGASRLWISFDVDSLDPIYAPGTGTAVRGGLTYREGHLIAETLSDWVHQGAVGLAGLDVVEVNPLRDTNNETARVAAEWIASFFGKTILHQYDPGRTER